MGDLGAVELPAVLGGLRRGGQVESGCAGGIDGPDAGGEHAGVVAHAGAVVQGERFGEAVGNGVERERSIQSGTSSTSVWESIRAAAKSPSTRRATGLVSHRVIIAAAAAPAHRPAGPRVPPPPAHNLSPATTSAASSTLMCRLLRRSNRARLPMAGPHSGPAQTDVQHRRSRC